MTDDQFDLLASLLRMTSAPILTGARLVLVCGEQQTQAAADAGCDRSALVRAVGRLRDAHEKIQKVYKQID